MCKYTTKIGIEFLKRKLRVYSKFILDNSSKITMQDKTRALC